MRSAITEEDVKCQNYRLNELHGLLFPQDVLGQDALEPAEDMCSRAMDNVCEAALESCRAIAKS